MAAACYIANCSNMQSGSALAASIRCRLRSCRLCLRASATSKDEYGYPFASIQRTRIIVWRCLSQHVA